MSIDPTINALTNFNRSADMENSGSEPKGDKAHQRYRRKPEPVSAVRFVGKVWMETTRSELFSIRRFQIIESERAINPVRLTD